MRLGQYRRIYERLNSYADIDKLSRNRQERELYLVIYTQKTVRKATRSFHRVKQQAKSLHREWLNGKTLLEIAEQIDFPPVLTGLIVLHEEGIPRKLYRKYLNNLWKVKNPRIRSELKQVLKHDKIYSPKGNAIQSARGRRAEDAIRKWLIEHDIDFRTERELRGKYAKTPDFLLNEGLNVRGTDIHWIESKASFGDLYEISKNIKRQLIPYRDLFGAGMVIYWFGFIPPPRVTEGILIESPVFFKHWRD